MARLRRLSLPGLPGQPQQQQQQQLASAAAAPPPSTSFAPSSKGSRLGSLIRSLRPRLSTTFSSTSSGSSFGNGLEGSSRNGQTDAPRPSSSSASSPRPPLAAAAPPMTSSYPHAPPTSPPPLMPFAPAANNSPYGQSRRSTPRGRSPVRARPAPLRRPSPSPPLPPLDGLPTPIDAPVSLLDGWQPSSSDAPLVVDSPVDIAPLHPPSTAPPPPLTTKRRSPPPFASYAPTPVPVRPSVDQQQHQPPAHRASLDRRRTPSPERQRRRVDAATVAAAGGYRVQPVEIQAVTDDGPIQGQTPTRSSSMRRPPSPGPSASLAPSAAPHAPSSSSGAAQTSSSSRAHGSSSKRQQRQIGEYLLGKTLGAGSMGKVKLGSHAKTGGKVAIKIIPRVPPEAHRYLAQQAQANYARHPYRSDGSPATPPPPLPTDSFVAKAVAKEHSKEVRTMREAAIMMLLHHPHICGMREMVVHTNHYYMMFELVSGGQMLDYIISHGRLRERAARKFARQIGSALEYCHRNSIVHRDLKIENILISSTGNIKIIDFGLSNLFSPFSHLSTFCGSLYFAAPELLNARVYTGPEVDVWSFGIVLYVLVCGKVPFDDQSMPALHDKIKKGHVEYPPWISIECRQLLQRMLVTNPAYRAPLSEVMSSPWMTKGFDGAPDAHLVPRTPLRADELDWRVLNGMTGFEFGSAEEIERRLRAVLEGDEYRAALAAWEARRAGVRAGPEGWRNQSLGSGASIANPMGSPTAAAPAPTPKKAKRASGFDFFKKKLFSSSPKEDKASLPPTNGHGAHVNGVTGVGAAQAHGEAVREPLDPTRGFHPLISIYYLVREKMERERVYGPGHFASSDLSLPTTTDIYSGQPQSTVAQGKQPTHVANGPAAAAAPATPARSARAPVGAPDYSMALPRLPAVASAVASPSSRMPSVDLGGRSGPTPRTRAGLDEPSLGDPAVVMQHPSADDGTSRLVPSPGPGTPTTPNLPRAPSAATHRRSQSLSAKHSAPAGRTFADQPRESSAHSSVFHQPAAAAGGVRPQSVLVDRTPTSDVFTQPTLPPTAEDDEAASPPAEPSAPVTIPPASGAALSSPPEGSQSPSFAKRFGSMLSRSPEEQARRHAKRQSLTLPRSFSRGTANGLDSAARDLQHALPEVETFATSADANETGSGAPLSKSAPLEGAVVGGGHKRTATVFEPAHPSARKHDRRISAGGAGVVRSATVNTGTRRASGHVQRPSTVIGEPADWAKPGGGGEGAALATQREDEDDPEVIAQRNSNRTPDASRLNVEDAQDDFKPIYLKGLFSVATTSTRSASALSSDIQKVLTNLGIKYRALRGGFECIHSPSIDLTSIVPSKEAGSLKKRPSIKRKSSRLSIGIGKKDKGESLDITPPQPPADLPLSQSPSSLSLSRPSSRPLSPPISPVKASSRLADAAVHDLTADDDADIWLTSSVGRTPTMGGGGSEDGMNDMVVRFEVNVIKVPWLPLHGVQFRRVGGNAWQYQMLAKRILAELKL